MRNICCLLLNGLLLTLCFFGPNALANNSVNVPILTYHNFDPSVPGSMTISTERFEEQIQWIQDHGYTVIPLQELVNYLSGKTSSIPEKAVVITADDGNKSVYTYMLPIVKKYNIPVTLFIYTSTISNPKAPYSLSWEQLRELQKTGLFDIQGHSYWHPNFKQERKRLSAEAYKKLVYSQLVSSKKTLDEKLDINVTLLAWPFGIYDDYLRQAARESGYIMAFSIDARPANRSENMMSQPRYMIVEGQTMKTFAAIVQSKTKAKR